MVTPIRLKFVFLIVRIGGLSSAAGLVSDIWSKKYHSFRAKWWMINRFGLKSDINALQVRVVVDKKFSDEG